MTERERIAGLAEQMELARKYLEQWPEWLRSNAHFSGSNHAADLQAEDQPFSSPHQAAHTTKSSF